MPQARLYRGAGSSGGPSEWCAQTGPRYAQGPLLLLAASGALGTLCVPESHAQSYVMLTRSGAGGRTEPGPNLARLNCFSRQPACQHRFDLFELGTRSRRSRLFFFLDDTSLPHGVLAVPAAAVLKAADACASCERALTVTTVGLTDRAAMSFTCADAFLRAVLEACRAVGQPQLERRWDVGRPGQRARSVGHGERMWARIGVGI